MNTSGSTDGRMKSPRNRLLLLLGAWDQLGVDKWRDTGLDFDTVLKRRVKIMTTMVEDVRDLLAEPPSEPGEQWPTTSEAQGLLAKMALKAAGEHAERIVALEALLSAARCPNEEARGHNGDWECQWCAERSALTKEGVHPAASALECQHDRMKPNPTLRATYPRHGSQGGWAQEYRCNVCQGQFESPMATAGLQLTKVEPS